MARRREAAVPPIVGRPFTAAEVARIARLVAEPIRLAEGHPNPRLSELHAIHEAAGRVRRVTVWECGGGRHDAARALAEELDQAHPPTPRLRGERTNG